MFFFSKKYKIIDTGLLNGATDWHCHILPGVDDGIQSMEDSLEVLAYYDKIGIKEVWLTPHIMEDIPNTTAELKARYEELKAAYKGNVTLNLAAENMMDNLFNERLASGDILPIGHRGDHLLVETSYFQPPIDLWKTLEKIKEAGYFPILAHPERYRYKDIAHYDKLKSMKVKLQLNINSLTGGYGPTAMEKSRTLLSRGYYNFFGSDLHSLDHFTHGINAKVLKKDVVEQLPGILNHI